MNNGFISPLCQNLKGKILVKAKKIGGLEDNIGALVEDSLSGEVSDDDDVAEMEEENLHRDSVHGRRKVGW